MKYRIEQVNEEINSTGGISLVGQVLKKINMFKEVNGVTMKRTRTGKVSYPMEIFSNPWLVCFVKGEPITQI